MFADVPSGVVTLMDAGPDPGGVVAVIDVLLVTVKEITATTPIVTAVAPVKPVPVIVTEVPPSRGPLAGETPVTVGIGA